MFSNNNVTEKETPSNVLPVTAERLLAVASVSGTNVVTKFRPQSFRKT